MSPEKPKSPAGLSDEQHEQMEKYLATLPPEKRDAARASTESLLAPIEREKHMQALLETVPERERARVRKKMEKTLNPNLIYEYVSAKAGSAKRKADSFLHENTEDVKKVIKSPLTVTKYVASQTANAAKGTVEGFKTEKGKGLGRVTSLPGRFVRWMFADVSKKK